MTDLLVIDKLRAGYGEAVVLPQLSLAVAEGQALALLGRNGTGKTTLINSVVGVTRRFAGSIKLDGKDITRLRPDQRAHAGVGWVPQERNIFKSLTVQENLTAVARSGPWSVEKVYALFPRVKERRQQLAGTLSGGEQQMVAMGRALMARPRLICMDEPSMGLSPAFVDQVFEIIQAINKLGTTIFVVEQNAAMALSIAHRGYVLQTGEVVLSGSAQSLLQDEMVQRAYLGQEMNG